MTWSATHYPDRSSLCVYCSMFIIGVSIYSYVSHPWVFMDLIAYVVVDNSFFSFFLLITVLLVEMTVALLVFFFFFWLAILCGFDLLVISWKHFFILFICTRRRWSPMADGRNNGQWNCKIILIVYDMHIWNDLWVKSPLSLIHSRDRFDVFAGTFGDCCCGTEDNDKREDEDFKGKRKKKKHEKRKEG